MTEEEQDNKRVLEWEQQIARQCIADLLAAGYELTIGNGGNNFEIPWTKDGEAVFAAMFQTDEEHLYARELTTKANPVKWWWVFFVHGNDGYDVISDYSSSLEEVLTNTNALVEKLNKEWEEL